MSSVRTRSIRSKVPNWKVSKSVVGNRDLFKKYHVRMYQTAQDRNSSSPSDELRFANLQRNMRKAVVKNHFNEQSSVVNRKRDVARSTT